MGAIGTALVNSLPYLFIGIVGSLALIFIALGTYFYVLDGEFPKRRWLRALIGLACYAVVIFLAAVAVFNL